MTFNGGKAYHGIATTDGRLTGATDTDYFYFFCPACGGRHVMRVLDYEVRQQGPVAQYPDERPAQAKDFILAFKLYCPKCKLTDFVKIGNVGWQGGELPAGAP